MKQGLLQSAIDDTRSIPMKGKSIRMRLGAGLRRAAVLQSTAQCAPSISIVRRDSSTGFRGIYGDVYSTAARASLTMVATVSKEGFKTAGSGAGTTRFSSISVSATATDLPRTSRETRSRTTAELIISLKNFTAMQHASLSSTCQMQVQMTLAANKAVMDAHHGNGFAQDFIGADGMSEVLKLFYHPDKHVHKASFGLARALCQQRWVARGMVHKQLVARVVPLIAARSSSEQIEACKLMIQLLSQGQQGGFASDVADQIVGNSGLHHISTALKAHPSELLGRAATLLEGVTTAGSACHHQLMASEALAALATTSSTALCEGVQKNKPPMTPADTPDLHRASNALFAIAEASVKDGPSSTAQFISSGAFSTLLQLQTPWLSAAKRQWQLDALVPLRIMSGHHPSDTKKLLAATPTPFEKGTTPQAWLTWYSHMATELRVS